MIAGAGTNAARHVLPARAILTSRHGSCRLLQISFNWLHCLGQQRIEQTAPGFLAGGEALFQPIAQRHQFIALGDDAALFGEGWDGCGEVAERT